MIAITRFEVRPDDTDDFLVDAQRASDVLRARPGLLSLDLARNLDEPSLWTLTTRWENVGSYRRALGGLESKMVVVPLLSRAIDEPSAYEEPAEVGDNRPRIR